jgi:hypothetical protein
MVQYFNYNNHEAYFNKTLYPFRVQTAHSPLVGCDQVQGPMFYFSFPPDPATRKPELKIPTIDYVSLRLQQIARVSSLFVTCSGTDLH